mmetsp:Transcript_51083/g.89242  ORF Transcript_51083/g.89242 Transcript_51083/m.89242 type:complete len:421 (+) Transcript_51083:27-1289(+)
MAELLAGGSGHSSFAPLSHSQTISIAKHLQDQVSEVQTRFDDFMAEYSHTKEKMQEMQRELRKDFEAVHQLQDDLAGANATIDSTRRDLARTNMTVRELSSKLNEATNNDVKFLKEAAKQSEMKMSKMTTEVKHCVDLGNGVRQDLENQVNLELTKIREEFRKMNVSVCRLGEDTAALQDSAQSLKADSSHAKIQRQYIRDDMAKTDTMLKVLEQRTADMNKYMKATRQIVDDSSHVCTKIEEDHDKLKSEVVQVYGGLKAVNTQVRSVQEGLEKTNSGLSATQGQLSHSFTCWDQTRQELDITKTNVRGLKEAHDLASARAHDLAGQLEATRMMAQDTRRGLIDTNSVVLPNLNLADMSLPRKPMTARGDMMATHPGSRPLNLKPLPKKVAAQGSTGSKVNGQGSSPDSDKFMDRMAWI